MTTGYNVTHQFNTTQAAQNYLKFEPKILPQQKKNGVVFVHGAGSNAFYNISDIGRQSGLTSLVVNDGFPASSGDNGGNDTWGNQSSINNLDLAVDEVIARSSTAGTKVALVSASMGGIVSLNYALANPSKVSCIISVIPVINIEDIRANNRGGYASIINTAYGGSYVEATNGLTKNPYTFRNNLNIFGIPMMFFYGLTDTLCLPGLTEDFANSDSVNRVLVPLATGHDFISYDNVDHQMIVDFLNDYNVG